MTTRIEGSGGGKGGGGAARAPVEQSDTLRSREYALVMDLICEGEIVGLVDGLKSVYLGEVPIQNQDGSYNYQGAGCIFQVGEQRPAESASARINGFQYRRSAPSSVVTYVNLEVRKATPVERVISNANVSYVTVTILLPALVYQDVATGDLTGAAVQAKVYVSASGGPYVEAADFSFNGKASGQYKRSTSIYLRQFGPAPWTIRMSRITDDSASSYLQNRTFFDSYVEMIDGYLTYPRSATATVSVDASQFSSVPGRAYDCKFLIIKVPSNYDPLTRTYSGFWDGTFKPAWSDNPAWCFYDLVLSPVYGLGDRVTADQVDKVALYKIAQYCDQLVPDGRGGTEPRFTCNIYLQSQEQALKVLQDMASIFRGMAYYGTDSIVAVQDAPEDAYALYSSANVIDGKFSYSGTSGRQRHTAVLVAWNDPKDFYRQKIEYVEDAEGIRRYGLRTTEIVAVGCSSQGQAHRAGRWLLYTERMETEICTFGVGLDSAPVRPGKVIKVQDPARAGKRLGGRITSVAANAIGIDAPITIDAGKIYTLSVTLPDGSSADRTLTNAAGSAAALTFTSPLTNLPELNAIWLVSVTDLVPQTFRVANIKEIDRHQFEIAALAHNASKYNAIEFGLKLETPPVSAIPSKSQLPITGLRISEFLRKRADLLEIVLSIGWDAPVSATSYLVDYQLPNGNWIPNGEQSATIADIPIAMPGLYHARVTAINALGRKSTPVVDSYNVVGEAAPPPELTTFLVARQPDGTRQFSWTMVAPPIDYEGAAVLRYKAGTGHTWAAMAPLHDGIVTASPFETNQLSAGTYTFAAKAVDRARNESVNAKYVELTIGDPRLAGAIDIISERRDGWPGTKTSCRVEIESGNLTANETDPTPWVRTWVGMWIKTPAGTLVYERTIDLGAVTTFTPLVNADGTGTISITETHSSDGISYTAPASAGLLLTTRFVKVRVQCVGAWPVLREVTTILSATPISEDVEDLSTATITGVRRIAVGDVRIPLAKTYIAIKRVDVALQNVGPGWSWELVDKVVTNGPRIKIYNAANALADAVIDVTVRGF
mgnify:CR=1 FL=1